MMALKHAKIEKIIISRPAVDSGASIGYLPGTMEEKMGPYMTPIFDELSYFAEPKAIKVWQEHKIIEIVPLSLMRGRTFLNSFVILDEAQNATFPELKMILTRIGLNSKMVITGDLHQSDLPTQICGGFHRIIQALHDLPGVGIASLTAKDIVRHHLIAEIEARLR
jgi:phosphate starvation-inducible PhoH-like protein